MPAFSIYVIYCLGLLGSNSCAQQSSSPAHAYDNETILTGAEHFLSLPEKDSFLIDKQIALVVNQTSIAYGKHLVDTLLRQNAHISKIFAPEHGFRGEADAGEKIENDIDPQTGLPVISLYGKHKKPTPEDMQGIDRVIFDIQDVGVRFYTYISTLHYVMEACAENNVPLIVLDRPNPNGHYIDGPILNPDYQSFVGVHEIPVVYGMTIGELAQMINGERWLNKGLLCDLTVIPCLHYTHDSPYSLPVKPSPNLPNDRAIALYPSICYFEGTNISVGRGTDYPFQVIGAPEIPEEMTQFSFTPQPNFGAAYPKHDGKACFGFDLRTADSIRTEAIDLQYVITMYNLYPDQDAFFLETGFFDVLAGTNQLRLSIIAGKTAEEIHADWKEGLTAFKTKRAKYLLYE